MKQLGKVRWLYIAYVACVILIIYFSFFGGAIDRTNIVINSILLGIILYIFIKSSKHMNDVEIIAADLKRASEKIKTDFSANNSYLWENYQNENAGNLFENTELHKNYKIYLQERKRLEIRSSGNYKCGIEDYINIELIDTVMKKNVLNLVPGVMTGLGILGTFVGLSIGLEHFNTGTSEEIATSIAPLMDGIKVAFHTSIYGMVFSLVFNFIYKEILEDAYMALDNFLSYFNKCVDTDADSDNNSLLQNMLKRMPEEIGIKVAEILTPAVNRMNETLENFTQNIANTQVKGVAEIVDHFMETMNKSLGESFNVLEQTIKRTCKLQEENGELMTYILSEVKDLTGNITNINELSVKTIEGMSEYVNKIEDMQSLVNDGFTKMHAHLEQQKEYDDKLKEYIDLLVNYERQIGEASIQFSEYMAKQLEMLGVIENQISESTLKNLEMLAVTADEYNKTLAEVAKQELQNLLSMADDYSEKVIKHLNAVEDMSEQFTESATENLQMLTMSAAEFHKNMEKETKMQMEAFTDIVEKKMQITYDMTEEYSEKVSVHFSSLEKMNDTFAESARDNLKMLSSNAQAINETLAIEAEKQMDKLISFSNRQVGDMDRASDKLVEASNQLNDKLVISLKNVFSVFDENLAEITQHLSGTISGIEETTDRVPQVVKASYEGMRRTFEDMQKKYELLIDAMDKMATQLNKCSANMDTTEEQVD